MKAVITFLNISVLFLTFGISLNSQISIPPLSSYAAIEQSIGFSKLRIEYHRPNVKGRTIFGELIPYGINWRTGANSATRLTIDGNVFVEDQPLEEGQYAILSVPNKELWQIKFYDYKSDDWTSYVNNNPELTLDVKPSSLADKIETMEWSFSEVGMNRGKLDMRWEKTHISLNVKTDIHDKVKASIDSELNNPNADKYYDAAVYYHGTKKDLKKALEYIEKATDNADPGFWRVRLKAVILADMGVFKEAIETATLSKELAIAADNFYTDYYVRINDISIKEWVNKTK